MLDLISNIYLDVGKVNNSESQMLSSLCYLSSYPMTDARVVTATIKLAQVSLSSLFSSFLFPHFLIFSFRCYFIGLFAVIL